MGIEKVYNYFSVNGDKTNPTLRKTSERGGFGYTTVDCFSHVHDDALGDTMLLVIVPNSYTARIPQFGKFENR